MTRYLLDRGRKLITTVAGPADTTGGLERLAGFQDVLGAGRPAAASCGPPTTASTPGGSRWRGCSSHARTWTRCSSASDLLAAGALESLRAAGRRVPQDVLVGGFDDSAVASATRPPLTTVRQPLARIAAEMVEVLCRADGRAPGVATDPRHRAHPPGVGLTTSFSRVSRMRSRP